MAKPPGARLIGSRVSPSANSAVLSAAGRDLRLVAAGVERRAGGGGQARGLPGRRQLAREQRPGERLRRRIRGVVDDEAERPEQVVHHAGEGARQRHAVAVVAGERGDQRVGELGGRERLAQGGEDGGGGAGRQRQGRDRTRPGPRRRADADGLRRQLGVEHRTPGDLVPVVILGVDPEHRHRGDAVRRLDRARQLDGGQGLEQREDGAAEGAGLLAGGDRPRRADRPGARRWRAPARAIAGPPAGRRGRRRWPPGRAGGP